MAEQMAQLHVQMCQLFAWTIVAAPTLVGLTNRTGTDVPRAISNIALSA